MALRSFYAAFVHRPSAGPIECTARTLRAGRSSTAVQVELTQDARTVAVADAWLVSVALLSAGSSDDARAPAPHDCPESGWIGEVLPGFRRIEERAIDFPTERAELDGGGHARCDLWARGRVGIADAASGPAELDLMLLDSHLLDAVLRSEGVDAVDAVSLDLWVSWLGHTPGRAWRRVSTEAAIADSAAVTSGRVTTEDGRLCAIAGGHARIFRRA